LEEGSGLRLFESVLKAQGRLGFAEERQANLPEEGIN